MQGDLVLDATEESAIIELKVLAEGLPEECHAIVSPCLHQLLLMFCELCCFLGKFPQETVHNVGLQTFFMALNLEAVLSHKGDELLVIPFQQLFQFIIILVCLFHIVFVPLFSSYLSCRTQRFCPVLFLLSPFSFKIESEILI